jgi:exopolysaccharide production protein ExoQ
VHWLCLAVFAGGGVAIVFGGAGDVANALGRDATFSGRTDIWNALIPAAYNPMIGAGFESFWNSPNVLIFQRTLQLAHWYHPEGLNEAHNGYLEVYLNLGWIGVCLIALILTTGYSRACKTIGRNCELASLMLAYIITGAIYSITEAGFRTLNPMWIFILLAVLSVSGAHSACLQRKRNTVVIPRRTKTVLPPVRKNALSPSSLNHVADESSSMLALQAERL